MRKDVLPHGWNRLAHPADLFSQMQRHMEQMFDRDWPFRGSGRGEGLLSPDIDVEADADKIVVKADLPGLSEKDVEVTLEDHALRLRGERKSEREDKDESRAYYRREISYGAFERVIPIDVEVDASKVTASFDKGVLTVTLPKSTKAKEAARRIEVKPGGQAGPS